jgi:hypothetical protein
MAAKLQKVFESQFNSTQKMQKALEVIKHEKTDVPV